MCAIEYYTYDDYKHWEGNWELIDGVPLAMAPAPMIKHQSLAAMIERMLWNQLDKCQNCMIAHEVDYKINEDTILKPDIVMICDEPNEAYVTKAPKIIVEIISPSTAKRDEKYKFSIYEEQKVQYYILVYPDDLIARVYKLDGKQYDKQGDFSHESYSFEELECKVNIDFNEVFKRFRR